MYNLNGRNGYGISHTCFLFGGWITDLISQNWWNMSFGNFLGICKNLYFFTRSFVFAKLLLKSIYKLLLKLHVLHTFCLSFIFWDRLPIRSTPQCSSVQLISIYTRFLWFYEKKVNICESCHAIVISGIFTKKVTKLTCTI